MEYKISDRVQTLKPSAIREIFKYAADPTVVSLSAGNPEMCIRDRYGCYIMQGNLYMENVFAYFPGRYGHRAGNV